LVAPGPSGQTRSPRQLADLVLHLARRELESAHRFTLLGWLWPLIRQLAQLAVLVFLFSKVLPLDIENFGLFVFTGLLVWAWFATALTESTRVLVAQRHLVFSPRFPTIALPLVTVAVPLMDLLLVLPILLIALATQGLLQVTVLLLPLLLGLQFALTAGMALVLAAANVYFRDVQNIVGVGTLLLFYLTPVFYGLKNVPEQYQWLISLNPLTPLISSVRAVLLEGRVPAGADLAVIVPLSVVSLVVGLWVFSRLQADLVDEL